LGHASFPRIFGRAYAYLTRSYRRIRAPSIQPCCLGHPLAEVDCAQVAVSLRDVAKYGFLPLATSPTFPAIITAFRRCSDTHGVSAHSPKLPRRRGGRLRDRELDYHVSTADVSAGIDLPDVRTHPSGVAATYRAQRRHSSMRCAGCRTAGDVCVGWEPMCARPCTDLHVWLIRRASCHQRAGLESRR
jgi:hypothetical protein